MLRKVIICLLGWTVVAATATAATSQPATQATNAPAREQVVPINRTGPPFVRNEKQVGKSLVEYAKGENWLLSLIMNTPEASVFSAALANVINAGFSNDVWMSNQGTAFIPANNVAAASPWFKAGNYPPQQNQERAHLYIYHATPKIVDLRTLQPGEERAFSTRLMGKDYREKTVVIRRTSQGFTVNCIPILPRPIMHGRQTIYFINGILNMQIQGTRMTNDGKCVAY